MSSSLIELARLEHEIAEKYEELIGEYLDEKPNGVCYVVLLNIDLTFSSKKPRLFSKSPSRRWSTRLLMQIKS